MTTTIPRFTEPLPQSLVQTQEDFELSINTFAGELQPFGQAFNQLASEMEIMAANTAANVAALADLPWVSGTTYTAGQSRYDPGNFFSYRRKTNGAGTTPPRNDPTNWALQTATTNGGADIVSSAVDISLTATGGRFQAISMTAANKRVKLPNATTIEKGSPIKIIKNAGTFRFVVARDDNSFVCVIDPGQLVAFSCSDSSTAVGVWHADADAMNIYGGNNPEIVNGVDSRFQAFTMLTATKGVCAYKNNTTGFLEVVVVNYGSASGAPVVINNTEAVRNISIAAQSASQVTVVYQPVANSSVKAYVIDISGNTPAPGAVATINSVATLVTPEGTGITALSATQLQCVYYNTGNNLRQRILDITGNTISGISAEVSIDATASAYLFSYSRKITAAKNIAAWLGSVNQLLIKLNSVTGSVPAPTGTLLTITSATGADVKTAFGVVVMSSTRALIVKPVDRGMGAIVIHIIDISGSTPALISSKQFNADLGVVANVHLCAVKLDSNRIYASWLGGSGGGVDSVTITLTAEDRLIVGQVNTRQGGESITAAAGYLSCDALDASHVMQTVRNASGFLSARVIEISTL